MSEKPPKTPAARSDLPDNGSAFYRLEAIISIDGRGQIVIPKEIREQAHIGKDDTLTLISSELDGSICCFYLVRTKALFTGLSTMLDQLIK